MKKIPSFDFPIGKKQGKRTDRVEKRMCEAVEKREAKMTKAKIAAARHSALTKAVPTGSVRAFGDGVGLGMIGKTADGREGM